MAVTHFQDLGQLKVGATTVDKVVSVKSKLTRNRQRTDITRSGDTSQVMVDQLPGEKEVTLTVELYDEDGLSSDLKTLRIGDVLTTNVAVVLQPEGGAATKPQQTWSAMTLDDKDVDFSAGTARPPVKGTLTFKGYVSGEEPEWEAIPS